MLHNLRCRNLYGKNLVFITFLMSLKLTENSKTCEEFVLFYLYIIILCTFVTSLTLSMVVMQFSTCKLQYGHQKS